MKAVGNKLYDVCPNCGELVQLNKFIFGDLHICTTEEERNNYSNEIRNKYNINKQKLLEA